MDRLPALMRAALQAALLLLAACSAEGASIAPEGSGGGPAPPSRVEAVGARRDDPALRFCDVSAPVGQGRELSLPLIEGAALPSSGWRWINVWATWCAPCVEEMPRIIAWRTRLAEDGARVQTYFLSVDAAADDVVRFRAAHPEVPESARLIDPAGLPALIAAFGLDAGATIPIHALVDPGGRLRCVRTGAIGERDYETVRALVRSH